MADPLNYPSWKKWAIVLLVGAYSSTAALLVSGMGAIFTVVMLEYPGEELKANDLMTYPTLFMGLGNLISMMMRRNLSSWKDDLHASDDMSITKRSTKCKVL